MVPKCLGESQNLFHGTVTRHVDEQSFSLEGLHHLLLCVLLIIRFK